MLKDQMHIMFRLIHFMQLYYILMVQFPEKWNLLKKWKL